MIVCSHLVLCLATTPLMPGPERPARREAPYIEMYDKFGGHQSGGGSSCIFVISFEAQLPQGKINTLGVDEFENFQFIIALAMLLETSGGSQNAGCRSD